MDISSVKEWIHDRGVKHQEVKLMQRARHRKQLWHDMIAYVKDMTPTERERERERDRGSYLSHLSIILTYAPAVSLVSECKYKTLD